MGAKQLISQVNKTTLNPLNKTKQQRTEKQTTKKKKSIMELKHAYLLWCSAAFHINPEAGNIDQETNQSDGKEFYLQMGTQ